MKNLLLGLLFNFGILSSIHAATTTGEAHVNMITPLSVEQTQGVDMGDIALDGPGSLQLNYDDTMWCSDAYVCSGNVKSGVFQVSGKEGEQVFISIASDATLVRNGGSETLTFIADPGRSNLILNADPALNKFEMGGEVYFTGNEVAGFYSTENSGGIPFVVNVIY
ncbi:MAG: DUF4402 domain-containing protein [Alphaproteobacteria bacterium]|nr:DUF4402 domain-containing protein [Alphaproteobacteria bacterium]